MKGQVTRKRTRVTEKKRGSFSRQREMHVAAALLQVFTEGEEKLKKHYFELLLIYREYTNW